MNTLIDVRARLVTIVVALVALVGSVLAAGPVARASSSGASAPENLGGVTGVGFASPTGANLTGEGQIIVVIDGAFNPTHPMLAGRVIEEACFGEAAPSDPGWASTCGPAATPWSRDAGILFESGPDTSRSTASCTDPDTGLVCGVYHGTAVAALAAGGRVSPPTVGTISGVAPNAKLILLKTGRPVENAVSVKSVHAALRYVKETLVPKYGHAIAAVNLSASADDIQLVKDSDPAPASPLSGYATDLKALGVALVIAAGNSGSPAATGFWSSAADAVAVGATNVTDPNSFTTGRYGSNASKRIELLAPVGSPADTSDANGVWTAYPYRTATTGAVYENNYNKMTGTSFAAPQVAGAFAVLRQRFPSASVDELTALMQRTGVNVADTRPGNAGVVPPRLWLAAAAGARPGPVWDFTGDGRTDEPVLAADQRTLMLFAVQPTGLLDTTAPVTVSSTWTGRTATAPVHDYREPNSNGFIATAVAGGRTDLLYHRFDRATRKLDAGTTIATGIGDDIVGLSFVTGLPTVGTGTGIILQRSSGSLELRTRIDGSDALGEPLAVLPAGAAADAKLVGVADVDSDGRPDLIVRDAASGLPRAYPGTDDAAHPFGSAPTLLATASYWGSKTQAAVVDDWASTGKPHAMYGVPSNGNQVAFPLTAGGTVDAGAAYTAVTWASGVRMLFAARAD